MTKTKTKDKDKMKEPAAAFNAFVSYLAKSF